MCGGSVTGKIVFQSDGRIGGPPVAGYVGSWSCDTCFIVYAKCPPVPPQDAKGLDGGEARVARALDKFLAPSEATNAGEATDGELPEEEDGYCAMDHIRSRFESWAVNLTGIPGISERGTETYRFHEQTWRHGWARGEQARKEIDAVRFASLEQTIAALRKVTDAACAWRRRIVETGDDEEQAILEAVDELPESLRPGRGG